MRADERVEHNTLLHVTDPLVWKGLQHYVISFPLFPSRIILWPAYRALILKLKVLHNLKPLTILL